MVTFFILQFALSAGQAKTKRSLPLQPIETECSKDNLDLDTSVEMAISYYRQVGMWSGIFDIQQVLKSRLDFNDDGAVLHLRYQFVPIPNNSMGRVDRGIDQRTFTLECQSLWRIDSMGPYFSASFTP